MRSPLSLGNYLAGGVGSGALTRIVFYFIMLAMILIEWRFGPASRLPVMAEFALVLLVAVAAGILLGVIFAPLVWLFAITWPLARRPIVAASCCASFAATLTLLMIVFNYRELMGSNWLVLVFIFGAAMSILAAYGYILTYFANLLERRMANYSSS